METCGHFRDLLLDSLYGLVEAGEEEALRAHVKVCPECAAAMQEAREQHDLLARAAHVIQQVPVFTAPEDQPLSFPVAEVEPDVLPLPKRGRPWKRWLGVSAAAALLLAAGIGWSMYQRGLDEQRTILAHARKHVEAIDAQFVEAQNLAKEEKEAVLAQPHSQVAHLQVVGPVNYQPDAPSPVRILTRDVAGKPLPSQVVTRLLSAEKKELFRNATASAGDVLVSLPAGLTVAGDKAQLVVEATSGAIRAQVEETIRISEPSLVTHLALNKSIFQVGEVLFFRTLTLERFSLKPVAEKIPLFFTLVDAKGKAVKRIPGQSGVGGIGGGEFALTNDLAAGEYSLRITQAGANPRMRPQERKIEILRELPAQFQFDQLQYFAGQNGKAKFTARQPAMGPAFGKPQELEVKGGQGISIAGKPPGAPVRMHTDAKGNATIPFQVDPGVDAKDAILKILVQNGANKEKVVHPIPVVASNLAVDFFPEGGDLLAGVPNRVYYRIRNPHGEPVNNPQGSVIILSMREPKKVILNAEQKNGLGMFTFTPELNETYRLWVTYPTGLTETPDPFKTIKILPRGVAVNVPETVSQEGTPLHVVVHNTDRARRLAVLATCRGRVVAEEFLVAGKGASKISLTPVAGTRGVVRLTIYDASANALTPLAERLIYRIPAEQLQLSIKGLKKIYSRGERASLQFEATDENGRKTAAWIGGAIVDERVLLPADLEAPSPQAHFFLLSEVRRPEDLEQADLLLADSSEGRKALDLFLGTQGWRRFVPADSVREPAQFVRDKDGKANDGAIFCRENNSPAALAAVHDARRQEALLQLKREHARKRQELAQEKDRRLADARLAALNLARYENTPAEVLRIGAGFLVLALLVVGVLFLLWGLACVQRGNSPRFAFVGSCCSFLVCLILYGVAGSLPVPRADGERLLAQIGKRAWPAAEEFQIGKTLPPQSLSTGVFALAPSTTPRESSLPLSTVARAASRGMVELAKADSQVRAPLTQKEVYLQDRFDFAKKLQENLAKDGKTYDPAYHHPALISASSGKGGAKTKSGTAITAGDLAREYPYAFENRGGSPTAPATLLWQPNLPAKDGKAQATFDLPRSGATYRIILFGNTPSGRLGSYQGKLQTK